jgi:hypothetical protein
VGRHLQGGFNDEDTEDGAIERRECRAVCLPECYAGFQSSHDPGQEDHRHDKVVEGTGRNESLDALGHLQVSTSRCTARVTEFFGRSSDVTTATASSPTMTSSEVSVGIL